MLLAYFMFVIGHSIFMSNQMLKYLRPGYEWYIFTGWWMMSDEGFNEEGQSIRMKCLLYIVVEFLVGAYLLVKHN
jgi:hypothetical protein